MADDPFTVEVVYATPQRQWLIALRVAPGTTAAEAVAQSGILADFPQLDVRRLGVFGEHVEAGHPLAPGDRVEIYRPLRLDPKEARRQAARRARQG